MFQNPNVKPSDRANLKAVINPQSATTAKSSSWVRLGIAESLLADIFVGTIATNGTVDAKLEQATSDGGTPKDVTGKAITQLTQAGTDSDKQVRINCQSEDLDVANGYCWVRLTITPATAAALICGAVYTMDHRYAPADATTVDEVVG